MSAGLGQSRVSTIDLPPLDARAANWSNDSELACSRKLDRVWRKDSSAKSSKDMAAARWGNSQVRAWFASRTFVFGAETSKTSKTILLVHGEEIRHKSHVGGLKGQNYSTSRRTRRAAFCLAMCKASHSLPRPPNALNRSSLAKISWFSNSVVRRERSKVSQTSLPRLGQRLWRVRQACKSLFPKSRLNEASSPSKAVGSLGGRTM
jgi:hypothetical protein